MVSIRHEQMAELTPVEGGGLVACHLQTTGLELRGKPLPVPV
jgi:hypothetical protein